MRPGRVSSGNARYFRLSYAMRSQERMEFVELSKTGGLDTLGLLMGTDKASLSNDYLHVYESMFAGLRDQEFDLIEIGVFHGESMKL